MRRSESEFEKKAQTVQLHELDPKPVELTVNKLKVFEKPPEDWGRTCGKMLVWFAVRGERLIKIGDSWFSTITIEVVRHEI